MTTPLCTFKTTASPPAEGYLRITNEENVFLTYTFVFFQELEKVNMPFYYYSTSATINANFKQFCEKYELTHIFTSGEPNIHSHGMSIRDKIQCLHPSENAQKETTRLNGTGFCLSRYQLRYIVALTKVVARDINHARENKLFG